MIHHTTPRFWKCYEILPGDVQRLADANFDLLKANHRHPSLQLKRTGPYWSVRVGLHYRALAVDKGDENLAWFWIGSHAEYDHLVGRR